LGSGHSKVQKFGEMGVRGSMTLVSIAYQIFRNSRMCD
jgi:hypothetical protein